MKKKTMALLLILCLILSISNAAFASSGVEYESAANNVEVIPIYGYLGPDKSIIEPDPDDPETPPEVEIYVEVPVRIMFAAFESGAGAVASPRFTITNLSEISDIKIEIENFEQRFDPEADLDGMLSLKFVNYRNEDLVTELFPANYPPAKLFTGKLPRYVEGSEDNKLGFMVAGRWNGSFGKELQPIFDMTLKFSAAE